MLSERTHEFDLTYVILETASEIDFAVFTSGEIRESPCGLVLVERKDGNLEVVFDAEGLQGVLEITKTGCPWSEDWMRLVWELVEETDEETPAHTIFLQESKLDMQSW
ncbi:hypothetical protein BELL_1494g00010 [Botrytis elliptica]|uniref:Uncharacterized protein n=1 Tax=Botrytis elliptica TaxID=278938 RepID=A0A4Z1I246_9HELO|nr:hypothetical protein BELL_1494g00010 [Botrytis elliptica]